MAVLSASSSFDSELSLRLIQVDLCLLIDCALTEIRLLSLSVLLLNVQRLRHQLAFLPLR